MRLLILILLATTAYGQQRNECDRCEEVIRKGYYFIKGKNVDSALQYFLQGQVLCRECPRMLDAAPAGINSVLSLVRAEQARELQEKERADSLEKVAEIADRVVAEQKKMIQLKEQEYQSLVLSSQANYYFQKYHDYVRGFRLAEYAYLKDTNNADAKRALYSIKFQASAGRVIFEKKTFRHHSQVKSAAFSADENKVMTVSGDGFATIWNIADSLNTGTLNKRNEPVHSAVFSNKHNWALTTNFNNTSAIIWNDSGKILYEIEHADEVSDANFSFDDKMILTTSYDSTVRIWDVNPRKEKIRRAPIKFGFPVNSAIFSLDGKLILTLIHDGLSATIWHTDNDSTAMDCPISDENWIFGVFSPDKLRPCIALVSDRHGIYIWNYVEGSITPLTGTNTGTRSVQFSQDGNYLVAASYDGSATIWDATSWKPKIILKTDNGAVNSASFSSDGRYIVTGLSDGTAKVWEVATGKEIAMLAGHSSGVQTAVFSRNGKYILTAAGDNTSRLWDFSNNGETMNATILTDSTVKVFPNWNANLKGSVHLDENDDWDAANVVYSPDKKNALSVSRQHASKLWDLRTGYELAILPRHNGSVYSAVFSPDSQYVLTAADDNTAKIWNISIPDIIKEMDAKIPDLSPEERAKFHIK